MQARKGFSTTALGQAGALCFASQPSLLTRSSASVTQNLGTRALILPNAATLSISGRKAFASAPQKPPGQENKKPQEQPAQSQQQWKPQFNYKTKPAQASASPPTPPAATTSPTPSTTKNEQPQQQPTPTTPPASFTPGSRNVLVSGATIPGLTLGRQHIFTTC